MKYQFEQIPHTADLQIRVYGATKKELFANALYGMFQVIKPQAPSCTYQNNLLVCPALPVSHKITITSPDQEALLVDFLSEALTLSDACNEAYLDANINELTDTTIKATIFGVPITRFEVVEIKAVTYHNLAIRHVNGVWQADIVFDI